MSIGAVRQYRASAAQERSWFLARLDPELPIGNIATWVRLPAAVRPELVELAAAVVTARHEALRTAFTLDDGTVVATVAPALPVRLGVTDLTRLPADAREAGFHRLAAEQAQAPFPLDRPPLWRLRLVRLAADDLRLVHVAHPTVADQASLATVTAELLGYLRGAPLPGGRRAGRYSDHAAAQAAMLASGDCADDLRWWRATLRDLPIASGLPTDHPRGARPTRLAAETRFTLPGRLVSQLVAGAAGCGATAGTTLLTGLVALLHRYTGRNDIVLGSTSVPPSRPLASPATEPSAAPAVEPLVGPTAEPPAGPTSEPLVGPTAEPPARPTSEPLVGPTVEPLVGPVAEPVVLRFDLAGDPTFADAVRRVAATLAATAEHRRVPFAAVLAAVAPARDPARPPLYQVGFNQLPAGSASVPAATTTLDLDVELADEPHPDAPHPGEPRPDGAQPGDAQPAVRVTVRYATDLFRPGTVRRLAAGYLTMLTAAADAPHLRLSQLRVLPPDDAERLAGWAGPHRGYPAGTLHQAVFAQADQWPHAPAVRYGGCVLSYRQLAGRAAQVARWLLAVGVQRTDVVGVHLDRGPDLVPTLLGVLAAGAAYLPLDPGTPPGLLGRLVTGAGASLVVSTTALVRRLPPLPGATLRCLDAERGVVTAQSQTPPAVPVDPADPACLLTPPGSPLAMRVSHQAARDQLSWLQDAFGLEPSDRVLHQAPGGADAALWEVFWPLAAGAAVVVAAPGGHRDPGYLAELIDRDRVTVAHFAPGMLAAFLDSPDLRGLNQVICSGGPLPAQLAARCFERLPGVRLHHCHGLAGTGASVTWRQVAPGADDRPAGHPVAGTRLEVLDRHLQRVPVGAVGRLHVGGPRVDRWHPDAGTFVPDPHRPGCRLHDTGELARWHDDGLVEHLGRPADEVRVRGVRIEPAEVRAALEQHLNVDGALVVHRADAPGGPGLVAYVRWSGQPECLAETLRAHLRARLPGSLMPAAFVGVAGFPLLPGGGLDRAALPAPADAASPAGYLAARTDPERLLCRIWRDLLDRPDIGVDDDFFALGGTSLLAAQLVSRIGTVFGVDLPLRRCFELSTVADYALAVLDLRLAQAEYDVDAFLATLPG